MFTATKVFFRNYWRPMTIVGGIIVFIGLGVMFKVDAKILAIIALVVGFITNGFAALATLTVLIPIVGPLLVKIFTLPLFYLLNGISYSLSIVAIKKGYGADIVSHRFVTVVFLIGVVVGYIVGNLLPV